MMHSHKSSIYKDELFEGVLILVVMDDALAQLTMAIKQQYM